MIARLVRRLAAWLGLDELDRAAPESSHDAETSSDWARTLGFCAECGGVLPPIHPSTCCQEATP